MFCLLLMVCLHLLMPLSVNVTFLIYLFERRYNVTQVSLRHTSLVTSRLKPLCVIFETAVLWSCNISEERLNSKWIWCKLVLYVAAGVVALDCKSYYFESVLNSECFSIPCGIEMGDSNGTPLNCKDIVYLNGSKLK